MPKSDIPMGSEFGPNQVDLIKVLELAQHHPGDGEEFTKAIASEYRLAEILQAMQSEDTGLKGNALEALAFYFMRLLGLEFNAWRKRGKKTGGLEVEIIVEGTHPVFSRWQIQCKNTPEEIVPLEDIAQEVGLSLQLKSNIILIVTTGRFSRDALAYADDIMHISHLNIVALDKGDIRKLVDSPLAIVEILAEKAHRVVELKALPASYLTRSIPRKLL